MHLFSKKAFPLHTSFECSLEKQAESGLPNNKKKNNSFRALICRLCRRKTVGRQREEEDSLYADGMASWGHGGEEDLLLCSSFPSLNSSSRTVPWWQGEESFGRGGGGPLVHQQKVFFSLFSFCVVGLSRGGGKKGSKRRRGRQTCAEYILRSTSSSPAAVAWTKTDEEEGERPLTGGKERRNGRTVTEITTSAADKKKAHWSSNTQRTFNLFAVSSSSSHEPALSFNVLGAKAISGHHSWCKRTLAPDLLKSKERVLRTQKSETGR